MSACDCIRPAPRPTPWPVRSGSACPLPPTPWPDPSSSPPTTGGGWRPWSPGRRRHRCGRRGHGRGATTTRSCSTAATGGTGATSTCPATPPGCGSSSSGGWRPSLTCGSTGSTSSARRTCGSPTAYRCPGWRPPMSSSCDSPRSIRCWRRGGPGRVGAASGFDPSNCAGSARRCSGASPDGCRPARPSVRGGRFGSTGPMTRSRCGSDRSGPGSTVRVGSSTSCWSWTASPTAPRPPSGSGRWMCRRRSPIRRAGRSSRPG